MTRAVTAVLLVVAAALLGILLLADPLGWFAEGRAAEPSPAALPVPTSEEVAREPEPEPAAVDVAALVDRGAEGEREAVDPLAAGGLAVFQVLDPAGAPVRGARVLVLREELPLLNAPTDGEGVVELQADARPAGLAVSAAGRPVEWREVVLDAGVHELRLADGGVVSGRLVREDERGVEGLNLRLQSDHPFPSTEHVPPEAWADLGMGAADRSMLWLKTDSEGGFEFAGLPWSWGGSLRLPSRWRVTSTSGGEVEPFAQGLRLARPTPGLLLHIAPDRTLRGRLVLRDGGRSLPGASLLARISSPDAASPSTINARTSGGGYFEFQCQQERMSGLELRLGGRFREAASILVLDGADIPADGDLGDVVVHDARNVPFLLRDAEGAPIAGGKAVAAGVHSAATGQDGRAELPWLPRSVASMVAEARGYVPTEVELPAVISEPLAVTLARANRLDVTVVPPTGGDPRLFKVILRREDGLTETQLVDQQGQRLHVGEWSFPPADLMSVDMGSYLCARPAELSGTASFHALRAGVEIELEVRGVTGEMVYHRETLAPLAPTEVRLREVALGGAVLTFRGRVLDLEGDPLRRATLQLGNQILGWTDEEGAFLCFLLDPQPATLLVQHEAGATKYLPGYVVPTDGRPVEFRLHPARRVTVEVVDVEGTPVPQAEVWTQHGGFTTNTHRVEGNRHVATSVPETDFDIMVQLAGRVYFLKDHDPAVPEARVEVPVHGRVVALIGPATTANRSGRFMLQLVPPQGEPAQPLSELRDSAPELRIEIAAVYPGTYQASLHYVPSENEQAEGRELYSEPVSLTVEAGGEALVHLDLPGPP